MTTFFVVKILYKVGKCLCRDISILNVRCSTDLQKKNCSSLKIEDNNFATSSVFKFEDLSLRN